MVNKPPKITSVSCKYVSAKQHTLLVTQCDGILLYLEGNKHKISFEVISVWCVRVY